MALSVDVAVILGSAMRPQEPSRIIARAEVCVEVARRTTQAITWSRGLAALGARFVHRSG